MNIYGHNPGYMFLCDNKTQAECLERDLGGLPKSNIYKMKKIGDSTKVPRVACAREQTGARVDGMERIGWR